MANEIEFNRRTIDALPCPAKGRHDYRDRRTPGLYLRVSANGVKTFSCLGRPKGSSRMVRATIGTYPAVTPDEAKRQALRIAGTLASGYDSNDALRAKRAELTLGEIAEKYFASLAASGKRDSDHRSMWRLHLAEPFGNRRPSEVRHNDIEKWRLRAPKLVQSRRQQRAKEASRRAEERRAAVLERQSIRRRGPLPAAREERVHKQAPTGERTANRCVELLRAIYNWASSRGREYYTGANPAAGQARYPQYSRARYLATPEVERFFLALAVLPSSTMKDYFLVAVLTGARRSNICAMKWSQLDLTFGVWTIPASESKNKKVQTVALSPEVVSILQERKKGSKSLWVFPSERSRTGHIVNTRKAWARILRTAGLEDLREHDLRRTLGSWLAKSGASLLIIGKALNHSDLRSTAIYARLDMDPVRASVETATSAIWTAAGKTARKALLRDSAARKAAEKRLGA